MTIILRYPGDIDQRTHLDISAWGYSLPSVDERNATGLSSQTTAVGETLEQTIQTENNSTRKTQVPVRSTRKGDDLRFRTKLYIPGGFGDKLSSQWATSSIALLGNPKEVFNGNTDNLTQGIAQGLAQAAIATGLDVIKNRAGRFGQTLVNTLSAGIGRTIAPNEAKIFQGADGRQLGLSFLFSPKDKNEGKAMVDIIDAFRRASMPTLTDESGNIRDIANAAIDVVPGASAFIPKVDALPTGIVQFFKFPPVFDIKVINGPGQSVKTGAFFEFRDMVLLSFDVSYSDDTPIYTYYEDGVPSSAKLDLQFESVFPAFNTGSLRQ